MISEIIGDSKFALEAMTRAPNLPTKTVDAGVNFVADLISAGTTALPDQEGTVNDDGKFDRFSNNLCQILIDPDHNAAWCGYPHKVGIVVEVRGLKHLPFKIDVPSFMSSKHRRIVQSWMARSQRLFWSIATRERTASDKWQAYLSLKHEDGRTEALEFNALAKFKNTDIRIASSTPFQPKFETAINADRGIQPLARVFGAARRGSNYHA